jgi:hypothetical protein
MKKKGEKGQEHKHTPARVMAEQEAKAKARGRDEAQAEAEPDSRLRAPEKKVAKREEEKEAEVVERTAHEATEQEGAKQVRQDAEYEVELEPELQARKKKVVKRETTRIVALEDMKEAEVAGLARVAQDPAVMQWVGDSKPWTPERVQELVEYARSDATATASREYFNWAVTDDAGTVVGFVGLRPTRDKAFRDGL